MRLPTQVGIEDYGVAIVNVNALQLNGLQNVNAPDYLEAKSWLATMSVES